MRTVLIVEDDSEITDYLRMSLTLEGCDAHVTPSRDQAIEFIQKNGKPDAIVLDWHMPGIGVEEFINKLTSITPQFSRLVLTTAAQDADDAAKKFNIPEVLRKPYTADKLIDQIDGCK